MRYPTLLIGTADQVARFMDLMPDPRRPDFRHCTEDYDIEGYFNPVVIVLGDYQVPEPLRAACRRTHAFVFRHTS